MARSTATRIRVALALALLQPCLLCKHKSSVSAVFVPDDSTRWIFYALCDECMLRDDKAEAAEARFTVAA
jgi:hypothetical protein